MYQVGGGHYRQCSRYDFAAGRITYDSAVLLIEAIVTQGLSPEWIVATHVLADHLFGVRYLQDKIGDKNWAAHNV